MTQHYSDPGNVFASREEAPTCECGRVTGHRCDWQGEVGELVMIEWMPIGLRASHAAAGNSGRWPHNGADRLRVSRECADSLVAGNDGWASEVRTPEEITMAETIRALRDELSEQRTRAEAAEAELRDLRQPTH